MRAANSAVLLAMASLAAAATIPDFGSKPHILMVRPSPLASPSRACAPEQPRSATCAGTSSAPPLGPSARVLIHSVRQVVVDDLGWHNVGWHNPDMITPNANKLVAEGMTCAASLAAGSLRQLAAACWLADPPLLRAAWIGATNSGTAPRRARPS